MLVLDRMLPGLEGLEIPTRVRRSHPEVPVLFLTAKDTVQNRIEGLANIVELTRQALVDRLDGSLRQATGRALTFTRGDAVLERDPLDAPGQPVGVLVAVMQEGEVVTASYRTDSGEPAPLPEEDVAAL